MVEKFKMAIEKMAPKDLDQQIKDRKALQQSLDSGLSKDNLQSGKISETTKRTTAG
jgi:hypothetical protein